MQLVKISLILTVLLVTNYAVANEPLKKSWSKNVWTKIDLEQKINQPLFLPLNQNMPGFDNGIQEFDETLFEKNKSSIKWNLWTIISKGVMFTDLTLYSSYNPEWIMQLDEGFFNYPITSSNSRDGIRGNFFNDAEFYSTLVTYDFLGREMIDDYVEPILSIEYPGEDSIDADGNTVYYPFETYFYADKDVLSYKLREKWFINQNGDVIDKQIMAIAPTVNVIDYNGNIVGQKELFWVDFNELIDKLKPYYILLERYKKERVISYYDFLMDREFYSEVVKEDKIPLEISK